MARDMRGNYYAIDKGVTAPEIETTIDTVKYGAILYLEGHPVYDRIIETQSITHSSAHLLTTQELNELIKNYTFQE